jgi:uncharacterized protein (TIRG00374 family)
MPESPVPTKKPKLPGWLFPAAGFAVSLVSLFFAFRKFDYAQLGRDVEHLIWPWVLLGVVFELVTYVVDGWRWLVILSPAEEPSMLQCTRATFIGIFANDVLPAKAGELIRPYLLSRWADVPLSLSITSAAIERIMDGIAMVTLFYLASLDVTNLPMWLRDGMLTLSVVIGAITVVFMLVLFYRSHAHRMVSGNKWTIKFIHLLEEIHLLGNWRSLGTAFALTFLYFLCQFMAMFCLARAFNFDFGLKESAFVLLVVRMITLIPNAPGNIGVFQEACEQGLRMLMVESFNAKSFSLIAYFFITAPPLVVGAIAVMLTGMSIGEIHKHAHHARREHEATRKIPQTETS